jgi:hypothetical protein
VDEGGSSQDDAEGKDEEVKLRTETEEEYYTKSHMTIGS